MTGENRRRPVEFWFDFTSPYAYFASFEIEPLARKHGREVVWRPFLLGAVFKTTGMRALTAMPMRGDYARRDWARLARRLKVPFQFPAIHPAVTVAAGRACLWIEDTSPALVEPFARAVFDAHFGEGQDISDVPKILTLAELAGADREELEVALGTQAVKDRLRAQTDEAMSRGVFGSPFFIVDGEPFWGADRLPMIDEWLTDGGW